MPSARLLPALILAAAIPLAFLGPSAPLDAAPRAGNQIRPQDFKPSGEWPAAVTPEPRCAFVVPVNVVRIYSDEHAAEKVAPTRWVYAQLDIANRLFRLANDEMAAFGPGNPAPCLQFDLSRIYDVHEREVSEVLGAEMDTEDLRAAVPDRNGNRKAGTEDLRTLKVTDSTNHLTVYCVWAVTAPDTPVGEIGGESNIGFADRPREGPARVLTKVTAERARMGVVCAREEATFMNTFAHELGHYFGLPHAWEHAWNQRLGLTDLGTGPQTAVDGRRGFANVMDYASGPGVVEYFTRSQIDYMVRFAKEKASTQILVIPRTGGGDGTPPPAAAGPAAKILAVNVAPPAPGGDVTVRAAVETSGFGGAKASVVAWFSDGNGQVLRDTDGQYRSGSGQVAVGVEAAAGDRRPIRAEETLTLPGGQLHLGIGRHRVTAVVGVFAGGTLLATSPATAFDYEVPGGGERPSGGAPSAAFEAASVTSPFEHEGQDWVKITATLLIDNLAGQEVALEARFSFVDGTPLRDFDGQYASPDGFAMAANRVVPNYERTRVTGMEVWIPVSQLHLAEGSFQLVAGLNVTCQGRVVGSGTTHVFTAGRGAPPPLSNVGATVAGTWVTHNQFNGTEYGLVVHADLTVTGSVGKPILVAAWFWGGRGEVLRDFDGQYRGQNNQVCSSVTVTPIYDIARFPDCGIFIPYSQLHLAPGTHDLGATFAIYDGATAIGGTRNLTPFQVVIQ